MSQQPTQPPEALLKGFESLQPGTYTPPDSGSSTISYSCTPPSDHVPGSAILVLLHGWPQTRYMWRYAIPLLSGEKRYTVFVPDLPGYGYSTLPQSTSPAAASRELGARSAHDRVSVGYAVLSAVRAAYKEAEPSEMQIVLITHDRGARVAQRLITSSSSSSSSSPSVAQSLNMRILGAIIMDIAPYAAQWAAHGADPRNSVGYWHWSFLPSGLSVNMVRAYGGTRFCREILAAAVSGSSDKARESFLADGALEHYAACYDREEVIRGAAADYAAGAAEDWDAQREDLREGRRVQVPVRVLHCERLQKMHGGDMEAVWRPWVAPGVKLDVRLVPDVGHYLPEEAPDEVNRHILEFLEELGV
ncbi:Alpha/Beta hydrolase protein [Xylariaceae sp. FL0594]|nr:Alpha/Beta hydrolase protein [Xylariaceae sp. FL0594]